jgi:hypothetical protein
MNKPIAIWYFTAALALAILVACSGAEPGPIGTAAEIADRVFAESGVENFGMSQALATDADKELFLGTADYPEFADSVAIMPMINIDTRVMVIIRVADQKDVEAIKTSLKENIDPNRVVCVTFSLDDVAIESRGDVIFLTINTDAAQRTALVDAFNSIG